MNPRDFVGAMAENDRYVGRMAIRPAVEPAFEECEWRQSAMWSERASRAGSIQRSEWSSYLTKRKVTLLMACYYLVGIFYGYLRGYQSALLGRGRGRPEVRWSSPQEVGPPSQGTPLPST